MHEAKIIPFPVRRVTGRRKRAIWPAITIAVLLAIGIPAIGLGGWAVWLQSYGNLHVVEAGRLYRSGQLTGAQFRAVLSADGIRSVINLRGPDDGGAWYREEIQATAGAGVAHYDLPMSAEAEPDPTTVVRLVDLLRTAPEPILVHCKDGADRTGLASALFELLVMHRSRQQADWQLSFYFGHFPWLGSPTAAMDATFDRVAQSGATALVGTKS